MNSNSDKACPTSQLDPVDRILEILFGLIMVLTFTSSMRATDVIRDDVREMFIGALGCNLAWGIIDALMYLIGTAAERGRQNLAMLKIKSASTSVEAHALLRDALPEQLADILPESNLDQMHASILAGNVSNRRSLLTRSDFRAALNVFGLVFLTIFPITIPFIFMHNAWQALRVSNLIALVLLFTLGFKLGVYSGKGAWQWGLKMMAIGIALVMIAIAFGG